jgi:hypothetical protein
VPTDDQIAKLMEHEILGNNPMLMPCGCIMRVFMGRVGSLLFGRYLEMCTGHRVSKLNPYPMGTLVAPHS